MAKIVKMTSQPEPQDRPDIFSLDKGWLRPLGVLRGPSLRRQNMEQRKELLDENLKNQPFVLTAADYNPGSGLLNNGTSLASYDEKSGIFEYKAVYWHYEPEANDQQRSSTDQHIISIRGVRDPNSDPNGVPTIIPDQIWWNGSCLFNGPANGGPDDPMRPENQRLLTRILELGKRINENFANREPLHMLGEWLADGTLGENFAAKSMGGAPTLAGLNDKGWDPYHRVIDAYFADLVQQPDEKIAFQFPPLKPLTPLDRLKVTLGVHKNTVEPVRSMYDVADERGGDLQTGIGYLCSNEYEWDKEKKQHVFRLLIEPENVPSDQTACEPFTLMELAFSQPASDTFRLEKASFMGNGPETSSHFSAALNHIGFMQEANWYLSRHAFPPLMDIAKHNRLEDLISELHVPPSFAESGGEMLWISTHGTSMEKKIENFGDGIGGGNMFVQRGVEEDGTVDEIAVLHGVPFQPGSSESDYDGVQPGTFMEKRFREAIKRGLILIDHIHFDHSTIEYFAAQTDDEGNGWFKGQKIFCKAKDAYIMKDRLKTLGVRKDQWPHFMIYDAPGATDRYPDLYKMDDDLETQLQKAGMPREEWPAFLKNAPARDPDAKPDNNNYAYCVRDEKGRARFWIQVCRGGTLHSAPTDSYLITGCFKDEVYHDTYYIPSDSVGLTDKGWKFAEEGQMALAKLPGISADKLRAAARNENELYIALEEPTAMNWDGRAPSFEESKEQFRTLLKSLPPDHTLVVFPFSTNSIDMQIVMEVCGEEGTLRNITAVGKNAETRLTELNRYGLDADLDLREVRIPAEKLPRYAYEAALDGVKTYLGDCIAEAERKASNRGDGISPETLLESNPLYRIMRFIDDEAQRERASGSKKPKIIFDAFLNGRQGFLDTLGEQLGFPPASSPRAAPIEVRKAFKAAVEAHRETVRGDFDADTTLFMLKSLAKHGQVEFATHHSINDTQMYHAIMRGQKEASRRAVRTSKKAKRFRNDAGRLVVFSTGPIGSSEEFFASLSRFRRGDSLFDYDEVTRNSGYNLNPEKMVLAVMQTPSMGSSAALAQDSLIQGTAYERGVTIHQGMHSGFRTVNPKQYRSHYHQAWRAAGWEVTHVGAKQDMFVPGVPLHFRGHRFYQDMIDTLKDLRYKAKLVEVIHVPSWRNYERISEACVRTGRPMSIKNPDTNIARRYGEDAEGRPKMVDTDVLTEIYWMIKRRNKHGKQFGWVLELTKAISKMRRGAERTGPFYLRRNGYVDDQTANIFHNDWVKAANDASTKQSRQGPSIADIRPSDTQPLGPSAGSMLRPKRSLIKLPGAA